MGALFQPKAISASRLADLKPVNVVGSPGWAFTRAVDLILTGETRAASGPSQMLDLDISGPPRVDGGYLARPSFPIHLRTRGPVHTVVLDGPGADGVELRRLTSNEWIVVPREPLDADLRARAIPTMGAGDFPRRLRLRRASLAPDLKTRFPARYASDEPATPATWSPYREGGDPIRVAGRRGMAHVTEGRIEDLVEYFAARTGVLPLSGVLELLAQVFPPGSVDRWRLLRSLFEAGILEPLRVRGWRGKAVVARAPSAAVLRTGDGWGLRFEGVVNEVTRARILGAARAAGLHAELEAGASAWTVGTLFVRAPDRTSLETLAGDLELPIRDLAPDLSGFTPLADLAPSGPHATAYRRSPAQGQAGLWRCDPERDDAQIVWATADEAGADRFWNERTLAVLDAQRLAGLHPFTPRNGLICSTGEVGVHLPLAAARWLRLATGVASGPLNDGSYGYGHDAEVDATLRRLLGRLLEGAASRPRRFVASRARSAGQGGIATRSPGGVMVQTVWRRARQGRRA
jgi:hypothetical protein